MDINLLLYARVSSFSQHDAAHEWLDAQLNGTSRVGLPWAALLGFVRLVSNPRVFGDLAIALGPIETMLLPYHADRALRRARRYCRRRGA